MGGWGGGDGGVGRTGGGGWGSWEGGGGRAGGRRASVCVGGRGEKESRARVGGWVGGEEGVRERGGEVAARARVGGWVGGWVSARREGERGRRGGRGEDAPITPTGGKRKVVKHTMVKHAGQTRWSNAALIKSGGQRWGTDPARR